ncbi:helix-turn-helix transcriptional regulator [Pectobacterium parvum]|uniref:helix-turn-helix transcriptional regulator n=1 Tax=Pectobacterium parvum TaxID=2778550 RepID=UPI000DD03B0F|nr:hypothetical protein [Pectobacterium parvum]
MAAVDPIAYNSLCKLFHSLTAKQATNCCLYSLGANYSETAFLQELSSTAVRRSLELTQRNLSANTLPEIKTIFWSVFVVRQIFNKYRLQDAQSLESFSCLAPLFPELTISEITCSVLLSGGYSKGHIAGTLKISDDTVNQFIEKTVSKLNVDSTLLLQILIISRLIVDLS